MSNYQRLISYIYAYEGGIKGKNIGFAKLETRGGQCKIAINVKKIFVGGNPLGVFLLADQGEVRIGTLFARNGAGEFRTVVNSADVENSGYGMEEFYGLSVHDVESAWRAYTTIWEDAVAHAAELELANVTAENVKKKQPGKETPAPVEKESAQDTLPISQEIEAQLEKEEKENTAVPYRPAVGETASVTSSSPADGDAVVSGAPLIKAVIPEAALSSGETNQSGTASSAVETITPREISAPAKVDAPEGIPLPAQKAAPEAEADPGEAISAETVSAPAETTAAAASGPIEAYTSVPIPASLIGNSPEPVQNTLLEQPKVPAADTQSGDQYGQTAPTASPPAKVQGTPAETVSRLEAQTKPRREIAWRSPQPVGQGTMPDGAQEAPLGSWMERGGVRARLFDGRAASKESEAGFGVNEAVSQPSGQNTLERTKPLEPGGKPEEKAEEGRGTLTESASTREEDSIQYQEAAQEEIPAARIPTPREDCENYGQQEMWELLRRKYPKILAFDYADGCEILTIKPQDIGLLPRETWVFGNNSFLLHGYYNYRYLILARLENPKGKPRYLLGVPGNYFSNEKYMAAMFGFPDFVLSKKQPRKDGRFGYWYTDIRIGD